MIYQWDPNKSFPVDPKIAGRHIEKLQRQHKGTITPQQLVDNSKPNDAPLHACFEWNNTKAANAHRKKQARDLIRSIRIVVEEETDDAPAITARAHVIIV